VALPQLVQPVSDMSLMATPFGIPEDGRIVPPAASPSRSSKQSRQRWIDLCTPPPYWVGRRLGKVECPLLRALAAS
jgi:hypothetical protein